ncbi:Polypeptide N-acetylgalactosaminyltransferase 1 [Oopsacas minuta]|uniref:Polypeptide N-acetylgalactosaminyltransferase n=1 Tax=Oopsacas minuta TaxID=111878 RepID=A0AAV7K4E2_9METZ|nr:Polypeptide N-acetylgalactosaminyltransferase 1 [Oopsacas minuta]
MRGVLGGLHYLCRGRKKRIWMLLVLTMLIFLCALLISIIYTSILLIRSTFKGMSLSEKESLRDILPDPLRPFILPPDSPHSSNIEPITDEEKTEYKTGLDRYGFNKYKSDRLPWYRPLSDFRDSQCLSQPIPPHSELGVASIVIIFVNEAFSVLMRSLTSITRTTPSDLLREIILVDDASDDPTGELANLTSTLNKYFPSVKLLRHSSRRGLMRARLTGASEATGDVIVFLDSHIECMEGWLEPLLKRIADYPSTIVCPVIDIISWETMELVGTPGTLELQGSFSWSMDFRWRGLSQESKALRTSPTDAIRSEAMAGGLFAIRRKYFFDIGGYDEGMEIWGAENIEMSFRIWMCGGKLEILPCSRVAHIFRERHSSYSFPQGSSETITKNVLRTINVWMGEYKEEYFKRRPYNRNLPYGDISERLALKERLECKSFDWYLNNIATEMLVPGKNVPAIGPIKNRGTSLCIDSEGRTSGDVKMHNCKLDAPNQYFLYTDKNELIWDDDTCLDVSDYKPGTHVTLYNCHGQGGNQLFEFNQISGLIKHQISGNCLSQNSDQALIIEYCDSLSPNEQWEFEKTYF